MDYKLRRGTRVKIVKDVRPGEPATGKKGKFVDYESRAVWTLYTADGRPVCEAYGLPAGCAEWDFEKDPFPKANCGIRTLNPQFLLEDGTYIRGGQCYWTPINPLVKAKVDSAYREFLKKMGMSDKEIQEIEDQAPK